MNIFKIIFARIYQKILYIAAFFVNIHEPIILENENDFGYTVKKKLDELKINDLFIVTDEGLFKLDTIQSLIKSVSNSGIKITVFHHVNPNPSIKNVEDGVKEYINNNHHAILTIGGGSSMDAAKVIAARISNPKRNVKQMKGMLKIRHKLPPLFAVPTTAGTGSETTIAAVIVDEENHDKYAINDPKLIPDFVIFEPNILVTLPSHFTSTTGMDALTHAVEAYIGKSNTSKTKKNALSAIKLISNNLLNSYNNPSDINFRRNMQLASYQAGIAFTRAYVGSVHAVAHALGGKYNVPHGLANAIILPLVLRKYGKSAYSKLAKIYDYIFPKDKLSRKEKAIRFIDYIDSLNEKMNITNSFAQLIRKEDINFLSLHAYKESYPLYPTPRLLTLEEYRDIFFDLSKF